MLTTAERKSRFDLEKQIKQGRIHGRTVADGLAGAVMPKTARNSKMFQDQPTDRPTDTVRCRVACLRLKRRSQVFQSFAPFPSAAASWSRKDKEKKTWPDTRQDSCGQLGRGRLSDCPIVAIQKYLGRADRPTDRPTDQLTNTARSRVTCPHIKLDSVGGRGEEKRLSRGSEGRRRA